MGLHLREDVKGVILILNPNSISLSFEEIWSFLTWYQSLVWQEVLGSSYFFAIYSPFVDLKIHGGLYLVYLTFHVQVWGFTGGRMLKTSYSY